MRSGYVCKKGGLSQEKEAVLQKIDVLHSEAQTSAENRFSCKHHLAKLIEKYILAIM